jgi:tetratricopeptide (TPR) repeat protein
MAINKNKVMEVAQKLVEKGQTDKAIKEYLKIVQEDPKDVRVWLKIGDLYAKKGAKTDATETYLKVAQFYREQGFFLKAVAVYKQILKIDARLVDVNLKLAEVYRQLGLQSDAMQQYELVAAFYSREGKTKEALATIRDLVAMDPDNVATRIKLAEAYSKENLNGEAIEEFTRAADYLRGQGRTDDFLKVAERLVFHQPENHAVNKELAGLYLKRQDPRRALTKLQICFKADSRDVDTLTMLAQAFQSLDQKPKSVSVWKELARVHTENGHKTQAIEIWKRILQIAPEDVDAQVALGNAAQPPAGLRKPASSMGGMPMGSQASHANSVRVAMPSRAMPPPSAAVPPPRPHTPVPRMPSGSPLTPAPAVPSSRTRAPLRPGGFEDEAQLTPLGEIDEVSREVTSSVRSTDELEIEELGTGDDDLLMGDAAGEAHADEINKLLTETEVYIKYGLHQKAVDHLQKVFAVDPTNVEAREKLKDAYLALGRRPDAANEICRLIEIIAPRDPDRARVLLVELGKLVPSDGRRKALGDRFRLEAAPSAFGATPLPAPLPEPDEPGELGDQPGAAGIDDEEIDDFDNPGPRSSGALGAALRDLGVGLPPRGPAPPQLDGDDDPAMEFGGLDADEELGEDIELSSSDAIADLNLNAGVAGAVAVREASGTSTLELDDLELEEEPPAEAPLKRTLTGDERDASEPGVDLLDLDDDLGLPSRPEHTNVVNADQVESERSISAVRAVDFDRLDAAVEAGPPTHLPPSEPVLRAVPTPLGGPPPPAPSQLESELDEADFFIGQALFDEAREMLADLSARHPGHPLVEAKLAELEAAAGGGEPAPAAEPPAKKPTMISQQAIGEADAETHYDLGMAYKEMGLYDEAIKEFSLVREAPGRAVQCCLMIGLCHTSVGKLAEAVGEFKSGLYTPGITEHESLALYYELGIAYEALEDAREALYYFEKVAKRDQRFRDIVNRLAAARAKASATRGGGSPLESGDL